jgi:hypothetical protein
MGWKFCSRPSKLQFWKVRTNILQVIHKCEEWQGNLYAIVKNTTTNHQTCWGLLWTFVEIN